MTTNETTLPQPESAYAPRLVAVGGLVLLAPLVFVVGAIVLDDSLFGDGSIGLASEASGLALALSALTGLLAAALPRATLGRQLRTKAVMVQYALALIAPLIAAMD
ncbi:hypothetical protein AB0M39_11945 [Streptomyces sp. NPDC051907]|uniref:hypothetical protein n=1 Tax=Streptomyces sp. NPDC051907 TaxID=3155284 RepID=UPI00341D44C2